MLRRGLLGILKGLLVGGVFGAAFHFALGGHAFGGAGLAVFVSSLAAAVASVVSGQPPWREGAWVGSILKGVVGAAVGAGLGWAATRWLGGTLPTVFGLPEGSHWWQAPLLLVPGISAPLAALVELDDGGAPEAPRTGVRVSGTDGDPDASSEDEIPTDASSQRARGSRSRAE